MLKIYRDILPLGLEKKNSIHCKKFWAKYLEFFYIRVKKNLMFYTDKLILKISKMISHSKGDKNYFRSVCKKLRIFKLFAIQKLAAPPQSEFFWPTCNFSRISNRLDFLSNGHWVHILYLIWCTWIGDIHLVYSYRTNCNRYVFTTYIYSRVFNNGIRCILPYLP